MQINGLTSHTTQIASSSRTHHTTIEMPKQNTLQDSVSITELGKRISMRGTEKAGSLMRSSSSQVQGVAELMSKSLAKIESTLERMKELTQKASNADLTELDRMTMQIEFEELRETLSGASLKMNEGLAEITGKKVDKPKLTAPVAAPDGTKILERARDRLMRGEKWDVAEAYQHVFDEKTGEEVAGRWMTGDLQYIIDGTKLDTVRDKIEANDTVNLMSIKTAREGIERVDTQLMRVHDMREKFSSFIMNYNGDDLDGGMKVKDLDEAERKNKFDSILGIVEYQGAANGPEFAHSEPKLIKPTNAIGFMFSRIDEMFTDIAGKLAANPISEEVTDSAGVEDASFYENLRTDSPITIEGYDDALKPEDITAIIEEAKIIREMKNL